MKSIYLRWLKANKNSDGTIAYPSGRNKDGEE